jgi:CHAT domain-containing protein
MQLPRLTPVVLERWIAELEHLVRTWRDDSPAADRASRWQQLLADLADRSLAPVLRQVDRSTGGALVLAALGELAQFPWHAALIDTTGDRTPASELLPLRYTVNAQTLLAAASDHRSGDVRGRGPGDVLVATGPPDGGGDPSRALPYALVEAAFVQQFHPDRCRQMVDAQADDVVAALAGSEVWHLVCHAEVDERDVLSSRLLWRDRPVVLREAFAWSGSVPSLAVLAACGSGQADRSRPDEAVGFPAALMALGVRSVVSSLSKIDDDAAAILMRRFHAELRAGRPPGLALGHAQRWLRTVTRAELLQDLGQDGYEMFYSGVRWATPEHLQERPFADPILWAAFTCHGN